MPPDSESYADFQIIVPVWGEPYTSLCIDYLLPSLLAPGNLPALSASDSVLLTICAPSETRSRIEESEAFSKITAMVETAFLDNRHFLDARDAKHLAMTRSIYMAFDHPGVRLGHTVFIFLNPDIIVSEETLGTIHSAIARGRKAVMMTGLRTRLDGIGEHIAPYRKNGCLQVPGHDLSRIALDCLHPFCGAYIWNRQEYPASGAPMIYFETPDGSLIQQNFHLHPIALVSPTHVPLTEDTIDGDFVEKCSLQLDDYEIITDGEGAVVIEMSGPPYGHPDNQRPGRRRRAADYAVATPSDIHWYFFSHRIVFARRDQLDHPCPELDRLLKYIYLHKPRRWILKRYPKLDRKIFRHLFRMAAWLATVRMPRLPGAGG